MCAAHESGNNDDFGALARVGEMFGHGAEDLEGTGLFRDASAARCSLKI